LDSAERKAESERDVVAAVPQVQVCVSDESSCQGGGKENWSQASINARVSFFLFSFTTESLLLEHFEEQAQIQNEELQLEAQLGKEEEQHLRWVEEQNARLEVAAAAAAAAAVPPVALGQLEPEQVQTF